MNIRQHQNVQAGRAQRAFTLAEVLISLVIAVLLLSGIVLAFTQSAQMAEWSSYNLAAQSLTQQGMEQARAANWDPQAPIPLDQCNQTNFPTVTNVLDIPITGTGYTYATSRWTISDIATGAYPLKMIKVVTTWRFVKSGVVSPIYSNIMATIRAPNQ